MPKLKDLLNKKERLIIGLMSGTSCDGVDLALVKIKSAKFETLNTLHVPYSTEQKQQLLKIVSNQRSPLNEVSQFNFYLPQIWAKAIARLLKKSGFTANEIDLVGSHGQTVYHQPQPENLIDGKVQSTLQIGDPAVLAQLTGIVTVGDFRVADMALGGQGAPLVPYFDYLFFTKFKKDILALNIGGISNLTFIPKNADFGNLMAFDCGPGNMLIDQLMQRMYERPIDKNGRIAKLGTYSERLAGYLKNLDTFGEQKPPKSTGREFYGPDFVISLLKKAVRARIMEPDIIHTVSDYTAWSIKNAFEKFVQKSSEPELLVVGGGGAHNKFIMERLGDYFKYTTVVPASKMGLDEDFKEAICFAVLANELIENKPANVPSVTGARRAALLGKICPV